MTLKKNDIDLGKATEEAEERFAPEAKMVEALDFQSRRAGSNPVGSTDCRNTNDWCVISNGNDFTVIKNIGVQVKNLSIHRE